eukprot:1158795-Pelagomonas_calceolata.AAC.3
MDMTEDQARDAAARVAQKLAQKPYTLHLEDVGFGTFFFQCVFIRVKQALGVFKYIWHIDVPSHNFPQLHLTIFHDIATMEAAALARRECGMDPSGPYMPHLSLLYADLDNKTKEEVGAKKAVLLLFG